MNQYHLAAGGSAPLHVTQPPPLVRVIHGASLFDELQIHYGNTVHVRIFHQEQLVDDARVPYERTFGEEPLGQPWSTSTAY